MKTLNDSDIFKSTAQKAACVIGQADGGMVPLVATPKA